MFVSNLLYYFTIMLKYLQIRKQRDSKFYLSFIHYPSSLSFFTILLCHHFYALSMNWVILCQSFIWRLGQSFAKLLPLSQLLWIIWWNHFVIEPGTLTNLITYWRADILSLFHYRAIASLSDDILKVDIRQTFVIELVSLNTWYHTESGLLSLNWLF